jgi:hypothetical protein
MCKLYETDFTKEGKEPNVLHTAFMFVGLISNGSECNCSSHNPYMGDYTAACIALTQNPHLALYVFGDLDKKDIDRLIEWHDSAILEIKNHKAGYVRWCGCFFSLS